VTERRLGKRQRNADFRKGPVGCRGYRSMGGFPGEPFLRKAQVPHSAVSSLWSAATRYAELTKSDALIHRSLAAAVNGIVEFLGEERKRVPGDILLDAERLECLLFGGYDPHFVGDEPPGL
jgi:hypothetical protein